MTKIISFDMMKLTKDVVNGQPPDALFTNLLSLVRNNFPGVTHVAISVPLDPNTDFVTYKNNPSPRTVEAFTDFLLDEIHQAGYNVILRATSCYGEGIYNFPFKPNIASFWVNKAIQYLGYRKAHLKDGDICAFYPEFEGQNNGFGANVTDSWDMFYKSLISSVTTWSTQNNIKLTSYTTINESEAPNGWYGEDLVKAQNGFVVDYYPDANIIDSTAWIANFQQTVDGLYNKYGKASYPVFVQETADTRNPADGSTQATNPQMLADCFTNVIYPYLQSGEMIGINFWNLFDTPREGIVTIDGSSVSLNAKGQALAKAFQALAVPPPTPEPTPPSTGTTVSPEGTQVSGSVYLHTLTVDGVVVGSIEVLH